MRSKADFVHFLWRLLVVSVIVYVVGGIISVFIDGTQSFESSSQGWKTFVLDAQFIAFRVGAGSLALMAGLWLSTRPWDEA